VAYEDSASGFLSTPGGAAWWKERKMWFSHEFRKEVEAMTINLRKIYLYTSWFPVAMYMAAYIYVGTLDGWGEWATGKIIIASLILSLVYAITGFFLFFTKFNQVATVKDFPFSILLSSSVMLWFLARYIVLEIKMSF
jgi:hypothetical protein